MNQNDDRRWWLSEDPDERARRFIAHAEAVDLATIDRQTQLVDAAAMYGGELEANGSVRPSSIASSPKRS